MTQAIKRLLADDNVDITIVQIQNNPDYSGPHMLDRIREMEVVGQGRKEVLAVVDDAISNHPGPKKVTDLCPCCAKKGVRTEITYIEDEPPLRCPCCKMVFAKPEQVVFEPGATVVNATPIEAKAGSKFVPVDTLIDAIEKHGAVD